MPTLRTLLLAASLLLLPAAVVRAAGSDLSLDRPRCEYRVNPLGLDAPHPRLSWVLRGGERERGQKQTAYRILVARDEATLRADQGDLWDSGKVASADTIAIPYNGAPLPSGQRCWWKVKVWDKDGRETEWSKTAFWEMGLLSPEEKSAAQWITAAEAQKPADPFEGARWIWYAGDEGNPAASAPAGMRYFRAHFSLPMSAGSVTLDITADDQFVAAINGQVVARSDNRMDAWRRPIARDVTARLHPGDNVLTVAVRNNGDAAGLLARLHYGNATLTVTGTPGWRAAATAPADWQTLGFDDSAWMSARPIADYGGGPWGKINQQQNTPGTGRYLRHDFAISDKPVRRARLYASALGLYEPFVNGKRVGQDVFAPGWTDYNKRVYYQTYDVTDLVKRGANALGFIVTDGWYAGHVGLRGHDVYGPVPLVWGLLRIEYQDGTATTLVTDNTWQGTATGPIGGADLLDGESYDARREAAFAKWSEAGFAGSGWTAATPGSATTPLEAQRGPSVLAQEELHPRSITQPKPGVWVFDMGQNLVGRARLKVRGDAGSVVTLRFAEMLNPDKTIYTTNLRGARCIDTYTLRGDGKGETWEPEFTFRGFRYVEVTGWPGNKPPGNDAITAVVLHSDTPRTGYMETSDALVNQLLKNIDWGQRGNFLSVPTDCPQRDERLGWMGDAQIFVRTAAYNRDVTSFFDKWLVDVDDAQSQAGAFSDVSPRVAGGEGTAAWGDAGVIVPWSVYLSTGDTRFLADHYGPMTRWVDWCEAHSKDLLRPASGYGDWLSIRADTPKDVLATAYFAYSTQLVARAAQALGRTEDAAKYGDLFRRIRDAFDKAYVTPDGRIKGDTQTDYLLALRFDLLPDALRPLAAKRLTDDIAARNGLLSTGFVGVGYLCPVLSDVGRDDVAYHLLREERFPSWGYSIKHGATTIWERWDGWTEEKGFQDPGMNSFNHYSFGSVGEWLYGYVAGISPDPNAPGYRHILFHPRPGGLEWQRAAYESARGTIASEWRLRDGKYDLRLTIPANTTATVWVAAANPAAVTEGEKGEAAAHASGVTFVRAEPGYAVYEVTSGTYHFQSEVK